MFRQMEELFSKVDKLTKQIKEMDKVHKGFKKVITNRREKSENKQGGQKRT